MKWYVYTLSKPDGTVFYVGKGTKQRMYTHEAEARKYTCQSKKCRTIRKIWETGGYVLKAKVFETDDEEAAYAVEKDLIAYYGMDNLTNILDGGAGLRGTWWTEERRQKASKTAKRLGLARHRNPESSARQGITMRERNRNAKTYHFLDPFGQHVTITNLARFCDDHDLTLQPMYAVHSGRLAQHKGWRKHVVDLQPQNQAA